MPLEVPSWFKYRQGKAEAVGENMYKLTAPILPESFITVRKAEDGMWSAALRMTADGPDEASTPAELPTEEAAWAAAFELHRQTLVT